jgi:hypothetical protein
MQRNFPLLVIVFLLLGGFSQAYARKLELTGTVAGYERLFGHIYDSKKVHNRFFLVKVDKISKGTTDSEYLLVNYLWRLEDKDTPIDRNVATQWNFSLSRDKTCDRSMRDALLKMYLIDKSSNIKSAACMMKQIKFQMF